VDTTKVEPTCNVRIVDVNQANCLGSNESPMDFSYDNDGPGMHANSPFHFNALESSLNGFESTSPKKRPHIDSPTRQESVPSFPLNGKSPFLFTTPSNVQYYRNNPGLSLDGPSSSDRNDADSEGTPELIMVPRRRSKYTNAITSKVRKRRNRLPYERGFWRGRSGDTDEDDDMPSHRDISPRRAENTKAWDSPAWHETHRNIPYIVSGYLQLAFNGTLVLILLYLVLAFVQTIQRDVDQKVEEYSAEILQEMSLCSKQYLDNKCAPGQRVPAIEAACVAWENCMNRDPSVVGRAKVSAETFAEIVNSFIEPISYKTMVRLLKNCL